MKTTMGDASTYTKRDKDSGEFMAVKKTTGETPAKKFKGVPLEKD
jgi:hypothetical protein